MNNTIKLFFDTKSVVDDKRGVNLYKIIRLLGSVQFLIDDKWSLPERAVVDTGAPISLIPHNIWTKYSTKIIGETELRGVIENLILKFNQAVNENWYEKYKEN